VTGTPGEMVSSCRNQVPVPTDFDRSSVALAYERWAPIYDNAPNPLLAREERHLLPLLSELTNKRFLDLACGTGRWLEKLMAQGARSAVGIDCSAAMLRVALKKNAIRNRLARTYCETLPFCDEAFDLAICSFALEHIRDLDPVVSELARVMKPGADVFVSDLHPEAYARGWRVGFRDDRSAVQVEISPRAAEEIIQVFFLNGFECLAHLPLCLGDREKPIFRQAGKSHLFAAACRMPAILFCHFRRFNHSVRNITR